MSFRISTIEDISIGAFLFAKLKFHCRSEKQASVCPQTRLKPTNENIRNWRKLKTEETLKKERRKRILIIVYIIFLILLVFLVFLMFALRPPFPLAGLPHATFTCSPIKPLVNMNVTFDASASYDLDGWITSYKWDFGDETVAIENDSIAYHVYAELGTYEVTLVIVDNDNFTASATATVTVRKGPVAFFTYTPSIVYREEIVTFNASSSTPNGGQITSYEWDFGDGTTATVTSPFASHTYMKIGTHRVTLTITDDEGLHNSTSKMIEVTIVAMVDVYTQYPYPYGGQGPNCASDAFAPQQEVIVYAKVTYKEEPLYNQMVSFQVQSPDGLFTLFRTASTSINGIAMASFGIPWQYETVTSTIFGTWTVHGTVEVVERKYNDTLTFKVGWIIELFKLETYDSEGNVKTSFNRSETVYFKVYAKNIALVEKNATVTIIGMDGLNVPIGHAILIDLVLPPGTTILDASFEIPKWAFAGNGTAHANALTDLPEEGGVAYCPEITTTFELGMPPGPTPPPPVWIVELIKVEPCDSAGNVKTNFTRGETVYLKLYVENNALVEKNVTISVVVMDDLNFPIGQVTLDDLVLSPGTTILAMDIEIPEWAFVGVGTIRASAFTDLPKEGGLPYCPEITATFCIESKP